ncbi:T6SS effector amidase Tae4 family protein [Massilia sp. W12]|uniref:T6SS effector amidase Tae4 family protein n=1 Tax=Massilia sp. W12 TaxID=3126507 RepID=UPI0030D5E52D
MKVKYLILKNNHYSSNELNTSYVSRQKLYREIGYDDEQLIKQNAGYKNTCATRMSLALLKSGVQIRGRLKIKEGSYKGKTFEPGAKLLADHLANRHILGRPLVMTPATALSKLSGKKGIIFFWKIDGYDGGHIDVIDSTTKEQVCNSACYFASKEIWFWELD